MLVAYVNNSILLCIFCVYVINAFGQIQRSFGIHGQFLYA